MLIERRHGDASAIYASTDADIEPASKAAAHEVAHRRRCAIIAGKPGSARLAASIAPGRNGWAVLFVNRPMVETSDSERALREAVQALRNALTAPDL